MYMSLKFPRKEPVLTCTTKKGVSVTKTHYTGLKKQLPLTHGFNKKGPLSHNKLDKLFRNYQKLAVAKYVKTGHKI
jgi:hypothetical protein